MRLIDVDFYVKLCECILNIDESIESKRIEIE